MCHGRYCLHERQLYISMLPQACRHGRQIPGSAAYCAALLTPLMQCAGARMFLKAKQDMQSL